jgi:hypothetical protein
VDYVRSILRTQLRRSSIVRRIESVVGRTFGPLWLDHPFALRDVLARKFLSGSGLEIGALNQPQRVPRLARVHYVDRMCTADLRLQYPDVRGMVEVEHVEDGETLAGIADGSQDFLIANHFLEHARNPIGTLRRFAAVLRAGGAAFITVPDHRGTFDRRRPPTTIEHLLKDDAEGPAWGESDHLREFVTLAMNQTGAEAEATIEHFRRTNYSIHYHVWSHQSFAEFLSRVGPGLGFTVNAHLENAIATESICVLRKSA